MVKKKNMNLPIAMSSEYTPPVIPDNNPDGPSPLPDYNLEGARSMKGKIPFSEWVAQGESANIGDVNIVNANGVASSKGQGYNQQYNWHKGTGGIWNEDREWDGGNRTGE